MSKPTELKIAADIIRRVLDAAERGDIELLTHVRQSLKRKPTENKITPSKQDLLEYGRFGSKFTEKSLLEEIDKFDDTNKLAEYLRIKYGTRSDIDAVSRALSVPIQKNLDYEAVIEKIVDATLGYKLRSQAVRGVVPDKKRDL